MSFVERRGKVLLASRNEMLTIPLVLEEIAEAIIGLRQLGWKLDVVIVDDSDEEHLFETAYELANRFGINIEVHHGLRAGLGSAIIQGFEVCLADSQAEFIVNLDADGQHDARQMGDLLRMLAATDAGITIGSRWTKGGRCYGLSFVRRVLSRCSSIALHQAGVPRGIKDPTTSFRVYRRDTAELLVRDVLGFNGFSFFGAVIAIAAAYGYVINETPIHFRPRVGGQSNLSFVQTRRALRDLPKIRAHWSMLRRREEAFRLVKSDPENYTASRELEQLSNTPQSTKIILDTLSPFIGNRVMEVGAGLGLITKNLVNRGKSVVALEPDPRLFMQLTSHVDSQHAELHNTTLGEWNKKQTSYDKFDSILYINVLEHIENDVLELREASKLCAPYGNIVIFVPATPSLYGSMDWISAHFRRYRLDELEAVVKRANLHVVSSQYFDFLGKFPYWLMYRVLKRKELSGGAVGIYDRIIIPLSSLIPKSLMRRTGGKNLVLVCAPNKLES